MAWKHCPYCKANHSGDAEACDICQPFVRLFALDVTRAPGTGMTSGQWLQHVIRSQVDEALSEHERRYKHTGAERW